MKFFLNFAWENKDLKIQNKGILKFVYNIYNKNNKNTNMANLKRNNTIKIIIINVKIERGNKDELFCRRL